MNIQGNKIDTVYPLMGTIKIPDSFVGKGKLTAGVRKVDSKPMEAWLQSVRDSDKRLGITFQRDNRGAEKVDMNPHLTTAKFEQGGETRTSHMTFFSNKVGMQRGEDGKPVMGDDGKPMLKDGKSQVDQIFGKLDTVEIAKGKSGYFLHFACDSQVMVTKNGLVPKLDTMVGKPAEAGMGDAQFKTTLEAKQARAAEKKAEAAKSAPEAEAVASAEMEAPEGPEMG